MTLSSEDSDRKPKLTDTSKKMHSRMHSGSFFSSNDHGLFAGSGLIPGSVLCCFL